MTASLPHRHVAIEGPVGVGKTSLARRLADSFGAELLLEQPSQNPFLERFYTRPREAALPTQLFFLFQRTRQLEEIQQADMFRPLRIADFLFDKDDLFARVNLDPEEYRLYRQVSERLAASPPTPDLVIYLQAPVDVLLERIAQRGIEHERYITRDYLTRLNEAYMRFFHGYSDAPLLIVNAAGINLAQGDEAYSLLLDQLRRVRSGRHYFNPMPEIL